ncbi:MAG: S9 family peptidase [Emcibacteraceae bacterium]|nr:S9 family peptidase [Emcibacteraceae bacterium]MDG1995265.1 S9 family peptidase [Emcibacteraceae bacterium]
MKLILSSLAMVGMLTTASAQSIDSKKFTALDVFNLEYATDLQPSHDGSEIVYVRRSNDIMTDRTKSNLWSVKSDGSENRPLLSSRDNFSSPRWSPDGSKLAYLSATEGSNQIYLRWHDSGQTALLSNLTVSPSNITWSPDGKWIAFNARVSVKNPTLARSVTKPKGAKWAEPMTIIDAARYQRDGSGIMTPGYTQIFILPSDGGTPRQLTKGKYDSSGSLSWSADSSHILFSSNRHDGWEMESSESDIFAVKIMEGAIRQITSEPGSERNAHYSPDGEKIAFTKQSNARVMFKNTYLAVMDADGSDEKILTPDLDRPASSIKWAADSDSIYFQYDDHAVRNVARTDLDGDIEVVASDLSGTSLGRPYLSGAYNVSKSGLVTFTHGTSKRPANVAVMDGSNAKVLTHLNEDFLSHKNLGDVHEITYNSSIDGQEIQGWYLTPPNFDPSKKYPLILEIHGGPSLAYGPGFSAEFQRFAAEGYVVFFDNHRGSSSYGEAFSMLLHNKYSSEFDFADHNSGVDAMIDLGFIDEDNLFITGGSAGGIAAAYAIGLTDRFNAAGVIKPIVNWLSKSLYADSSTGQLHNQFPGFPWDHVEHFWKRSPMSLVGNVKTPTLLMTGEKDRRTPIPEIEQYYQALKLLEVDTIMVRVPGSPHGIAGRPSRLNAKVDNIMAWFERYKK